jgi:hypothetical protein
MDAYRGFRVVQEPERMTDKVEGEKPEGEKAVENPTP